MSSIEPQSRNFENVSLWGDFVPKTAILGRFDRPPSYMPTGHGLRYWISLRLSSIRRMANDVDRLFCATYHFGGRRPLKLPKFRQVNDNDSILLTDLQVTPYVFGWNAFYLIAECLTVCAFGGSFFFARLTMSALRGLQFTHPHMSDDIYGIPDF